MRVVVSGMVAGDADQGGATWAVMQYVLGLRELGHDVILVEPVAELNPASVHYFAREVVERFGLEGRAALLEAGTGRTAGAPYGELLAFAREADVLLNVSGMLRDERLRDGPLAVYLDLDPAFNQLWESADGVDAGLDGHSRYVTVGLRIGRPGCSVPTCGRSWLTTLPPVVLSHWPVGREMAHDALTTVGNWRSYGSIHHDGVHYGQRAHSLRELIDLPRRVDERLLLALAIHPDERPDIEALERHGWELADPRRVAGDPASYKEFVSQSRAELGVAKSGYVASRCGWFSDRSACYLASGRPVLAQDTGFGDDLPTGDGLLSFSSVDEAAAAIEAVAGSYDAHARAARELAEAVFDSRVVLPRLLEMVTSG